MSIFKLITPFPWKRYSKKLRKMIENPRSNGYFTKEEAKDRAVRLIYGADGEIEDGNAVVFYWLVDENDGVIVDCKFQAFGQTALIGAAEAVCYVIVGKNYDQARRISADLIDREVRDRSDQPAFPPETSPHLNLVLDAIEDAALQCTDIPFAETYSAPPAPEDIGEVLEGGIPNWYAMTIQQQTAIIEQVLNHDIRPYIALDSGGVEVLNLIEGREVIIAYQGACTSCYSAIGTTLSYIQQVLRAKVHPDLVVIPNLEGLFGHS